MNHSRECSVFGLHPKFHNQFSFLSSATALLHTKKKHDAHPLSVTGKTLSTMSTSLEKQLNLCPTFVTSKNATGHLNILLSERACRIYEAFGVLINLASDDSNTDTTVTIPTRHC
jgi:hypothetical protein